MFTLIEHGINSIKKQLQALGLLPKKSGKDRKKAQDDDLLLSSDDSENDDTQELEGNFSHETVPELPVTSSGTSKLILYNSLNWRMYMCTGILLTNICFCNPDVFLSRVRSFHYLKISSNLPFPSSID